MPGYFASNLSTIFAATSRSIEVWKTTLPSLVAALTSSAVIGVAAGAAAEAGHAISTATVAIAAVDHPVRSRACPVMARLPKSDYCRFTHGGDGRSHCREFPAARSGVDGFARLSCRRSRQRRV